MIYLYWIQSRKNKLILTLKIIYFFNKKKEKHGNAKVEFIKLDLGDLDSVLEFSKVFKEKYDKIDILLNNAGVMMPNNRELTK